MFHLNICACICNMYVFSTKRNSNLDSKKKTSKNKKLWWKNQAVRCLAAAANALLVLISSPLPAVPIIALQVQCWWVVFVTVDGLYKPDICQPRLWLSEPVRAWRFLSPDIRWLHFIALQNCWPGWCGFLLVLEVFMCNFAHN